MPDPKEIPHLLKLLDDESASVQKAVAKELAAFGSSLKEELDRLSEPLNSNQKEKIKGLLEEYNRDLLKEAWPSWFDIEYDKEKLETALALLAQFQNGPSYPVHLKSLLDKLADEYRKSTGESDPFKLADFLFKAKHLQGNQTDYYNPANSNLVYVIQERQGIPISLACVYILVGARLGLNIEGCNFPGHFLAKIDVEGTFLWVDCFNGGQFFDEQTILNGTQESPQVIQQILSMPTNAELIIARVLTNLIHAYDQLQDEENRDLMIGLLKALESGSS